MKPYPYLILSLFALVSCDSIETHIGDKDVYEFEETKKGEIKFSELKEYSVTHNDFIPYQGLNEFKGKVGGIVLDIHVKFTISDDDNCVYYIYTVSNCIFPKNQSKQVSEVISKLIKPCKIRMKFEDKEGNHIFTFFNSYASKQSLHDLISSENFPIVLKGKVKEHDNLTEPRPEISAGLFRSKIKRLHTHTLSVSYSAEGSLPISF